MTTNTFSRMAHQVSLLTALTREAMVQSLATDLQGEEATAILKLRLAALDESSVNDKLDVIFTGYITQTGLFAMPPALPAPTHGAGTNDLWKRMDALTRDLHDINGALPSATEWSVNNFVTLLHAFSSMTTKPTIEQIVKTIGGNLIFVFFRSTPGGVIHYADIEGVVRPFRLDALPLAPTTATLMAACVAILLPILAEHPADPLTKE